MATFKEGHIYSTPRKRGCYCLVLSMKGNKVTYVENFGKGVQYREQTFTARQTWKTLDVKDSNGSPINLSAYDESKYRSSKNFVGILIKSMVEELKYLSSRASAEGWATMPKEYLDLAINDIPEEKADKQLALLRESARCSNLAVMLETFGGKLEELE